MAEEGLIPFQGGADAEPLVPFVPGQIYRVKEEFTVATPTDNPYKEELRQVPAGEKFVVKSTHTEFDGPFGYDCAIICIWGELFWTCKMFSTKYIEALND